MRVCETEVWVYRLRSKTLITVSPLPPPPPHTPPFPNSSILQSWSSDSEQWCGIRCCCARKDGNDVLSLYGVFSGTKGMHEPSERKYVIMKSATFLIAKSTSVGVIKKKNYATPSIRHPSIRPSTKIPVYKNQYVRKKREGDPRSTINSHAKAHQPHTLAKKRIWDLSFAHHFHDI